jgi:hypothetical protein
LAGREMKGFGDPVETVERMSLSRRALAVEVDEIVR